MGDEISDHTQSESDFCNSVAPLLRHPAITRTRELKKWSAECWKNPITRRN